VRSTIVGSCEFVTPATANFSSHACHLITQQLQIRNAEVASPYGIGARLELLQIRDSSVDADHPRAAAHQEIATLVRAQPRLELPQGCAQCSVETQRSPQLGTLTDQMVQVRVRRPLDVQPEALCAASPATMNV
jgi:hypothetical protein